jgi:membrane AbrB-like protein
VSAVPRPGWPIRRRLAATLALATAAGALAQALHIPLPWMIGPLLATAAASLAGWPATSAPVLRNAGLWVLGTALGLYFTPAMLALVARLWPALLAALAWALLLGWGFYRWLAFSHRGTGLAPATAFFAGAIGGASEMALLAERHGGQVDRVAAAHSLRILIVVLLVPFALQGLGVHGADPAAKAVRAVDPAGLVLLLTATAAGGAFMHWRHTPNPWVLGALIVSMAISASGTTLSAVPGVLSNAAQLAIGVNLGVRFTPDFVRAAPRWLGAVAIGTLGMVALSAGFGLLLAWGSGLHPATMALATSPGGMAEMAITASVLALGAPVVTAFHVLRYVGVLVLTEPLWRREQRRLAARAAGAGRPGG